MHKKADGMCPSETVKAKRAKTMHEVQIEQGMCLSNMVAVANFCTTYVHTI